MINTAKQLPWGVKITFIYEGIQIVPGSNKLMIVRNPRTKKSFNIREPKAVMFRDKIHYDTHKMITDMKNEVAWIKDISFPIIGTDYQLRVDSFFAFNASGQGPSRMVSSDRDNLTKMVFDGLEGVLIDDDKWITEGYTAKGSAPKEAKEDIIILVVSRAGFRNFDELRFLTTLAILPPWQRQDQSKIVLPGQKDIEVVSKH